MFLVYITIYICKLEQIINKMKIMKHLKRFAKWYFNKTAETAILTTPTGMIPYDVIKRAYNM